MREITSDMLVREARGTSISQLRVLCIDNQGLERLGEGALEQCTSLTTLLLRNNSLASFSTFLPSLWRVDVSNNALSTLGELAQLHAVGWLDLSDNQLGWNAVAELRGRHVMCLSLRGNPRLRRGMSEAQYRAAVLELLPGIWSLDGVYVTECERTSARATRNAAGDDAVRAIAGAGGHPAASLLLGSVLDSGESAAGRGSSPARPAPRGGGGAWRMPSAGDFQTEFQELAMSEPTQEPWRHGFRLRHLCAMHDRQAAFDALHGRPAGDPDFDAEAHLPAMHLDALSALPGERSPWFEARPQTAVGADDGGGGGGGDGPGARAKDRASRQAVCALLLSGSLFGAPPLFVAEALSSLCGAALAPSAPRDLSRLRPDAVSALVDRFCCEARRSLDNGGAMSDADASLWASIDAVNRAGPFAGAFAHEALSSVGARYGPPPGGGEAPEARTAAEAARRTVAKCALRLLGRGPTFVRAAAAGGGGAHAAPGARRGAKRPPWGGGLRNLRPLARLAEAAGMHETKVVEEMDAADEAEHAARQRAARARAADLAQQPSAPLRPGSGLRILGAPRRRGEGGRRAARRAAQAPRTAAFDRLARLRSDKFRMHDPSASGHRYQHRGPQPARGDWVEVGAEGRRVFARIAEVLEDGSLRLEPLRGSASASATGSASGVAGAVRRSDVFWAREGRVGTWRHRSAGAIHAARWQDRLARSQRGAGPAARPAPARSAENAPNGGAGRRGGAPLRPDARSPVGAAPAAPAAPAASSDPGGGADPRRPEDDRGDETAADRDETAASEESERPSPGRFDDAEASTGTFRLTASEPRPRAPSPPPGRSDDGKASPGGSSAWSSRGATPQTADALYHSRPTSAMSSGSGSGVKYFDRQTSAPPARKAYGGLVLRTDRDSDLIRMVGGRARDARSRGEAETPAPRSVRSATLRARSRARLDSPSPLMAAARAAPSLLQKSYSSHGPARARPRAPLFSNFGERRRKKQQRRAIASVSASIASLPELRLAAKPVNFGSGALTRPHFRRRSRKNLWVSSTGADGARARAWNPSVVDTPYPEDQATALSKVGRLRHGRIIGRNEDPRT